MSRLISPSAVSAIRRRISSGNTVSKPAAVAAVFRSSRLIGGREIMLGAYVQVPTGGTSELLLARRPDISDEVDGGDSPWAAGPPIRETVGPIMYSTLVWSQADEASAWRNSQDLWIGVPR
jgi:hypothetical protein